MDEVAEELVEAAFQLRRRGQAEQGIALLADWPSWPEPEDRGFAQVEVVDALLSLGRRDDAAAAAVAALRASRPPTVVCSLAAETCLDAGWPEEALRFFDLGVAVLPDDDLANLTWTAEYLLRERRRARAEQGLPPDELDLVELPVRRPRRPTLEDVEAGRSIQGEVVRAFFWPRYLLPAAQERWPDIGDHADLQQRLLAVTGRRVELVAGQPGHLEADLDDVERYLHETDDVVVWPPERNGPCWCGSGSKYKKCCLRPGLSD